MTGKVNNFLLGRGEAAPVLVETRGNFRPFEGAGTSEASYRGMLEVRNFSENFERKNKKEIIK
jgi:hypothetical protein